MNIKKINCRLPQVMLNYKEFNYFASIEDYKNAFEKFKKENSHYPNSIEIDETKYLPSSRTIQRIFKGGLRELRELMGLDDLDYRSGYNRSSLCYKINDQSIASEDDLYIKLCEKYNEINIHRQEPYTNKIKNLSRSDFGVYLPNRHFYIDIFVPYNSKSAYGCIAHKLRKFKKYDIQPDIYLVIGNKEMTREWINKIEQKNIQNLIKKLPQNIKVITYQELINLIENNFDIYTKKVV